jgi:regulatory protein
MTALRRRGYVNDQTFALRWARARLTRRPMGRERLEAELLGQGLERTLILRALDQVYRDVTERDLARALLSRRAAAMPSRSRMWRAGLLRRYGFDEETVDDVLGERSTP